MVRAAVAWLSQFARTCRTGNEATGERAVYCALLYRLEIGPVLMRVVLVGLADSLPMEAVARVADIVAPLLHTPAFTSNSSKQQWAYAALR